MSVITDLLYYTTIYTHLPKFALGCHQYVRIYALYQHLSNYAPVWRECGIHECDQNHRSTSGI